MRVKRGTLGYLANSGLGFDGHEYRYKTGEWRYIERLAPLFDDADIYAPVVDLASATPDLRARYVHVLDVPNATVRNTLLGSVRRNGARNWLKRHVVAYARLSGLSRNWDFAYVMVPSWLAVLFWIRSRLDGWRYAVHFRGDWVTSARYRFPDSPLLRWSLPIYLKVIAGIESRLVHSATICMAEGKVIVGRYPDMAGSTLNTLTLDLPLEYFHFRDDTCTQEQLHLISVGSLTRLKGVKTTVEAVSKLIKRGHEITFHVVGDGPELSKLRALCADLGLDERIIFHGYVSDRSMLLGLYQQCDILVTSSFSEGFPRVIYEAMSQSLPVIATSVGGIPITLDEGETALLVEPGNSTAIADAVNRIVNDQELRQTLIRKGHELAQQAVTSDPLDQAVELFRERVPILE